MKSVASSLCLAAIFAACLVAGGGSARAEVKFIPRPTEPLACDALAGQSGVWMGYFHGRKEVNLGWRRKETTGQRRCFRTERACRNWLYNMQSEYQDFVWSATCKEIGEQ